MVGATLLVRPSSMATNSIETGPAVVNIPGEVRAALPRAGLLAIVIADALSFPALCDVHAAIADAVAAAAVAVVGLEVYAERGAIRPGALCQADVANIGFGGMHFAPTDATGRLVLFGRYSRSGIAPTTRVEIMLFGCRCQRVWKLG